MVRRTSSVEMESIKFIWDLHIGGVVTTPRPDSDNGIIALEITRAKTRVTPIIEGSTARLHIQMKAEGIYTENVQMHTHGAMSCNAGVSG